MPYIGAKFGSATTTSCPISSRHLATHSLSVEASINTDGWLSTGDLVRRDAEGYSFVVGRKKDMFKSGGENVYPPEIEQAISHCAGVREVAVVGVPDPTWGEVGAAFIVRDDPSLSRESVLAHCAEQLAKFKRPKRIVFVESLPKSENGKVLKRKLLESSMPLDH